MTRFLDFLKSRLYSYMVSVTCITAAIGVLGLLLEPERRFGYEAFFSPLIFGVIGTLPSFVFYSKKELSLRQSLFRTFVQLVLLEGLILGFSYMVGLLNPAIILPLALTVLLVFLLSSVIMWFADSKKAQVLTMQLKTFQQK